MSLTVRTCIAAMCAALSAGCNDATTTPASDAAATLDARPATDVGAVVDAGVSPDLGAVADAGIPIDLGTGTDTGTVTDVGSVTDTGGVADVGPVADAGNGVTAARRTMVGAPRWEVSDVQIFSATVGTSGDVGPLQTELTRLFGPEHRTSGNGLVLVEGAPHPGPYATELSARLAAGGVDPGDRFTVSQWTAPQGLVFVYEVIPGAGAPTGASADSASGPIIPASAYPLRSSGVLFRDGAMVDNAFDGAIAPPTGVDGRSHGYVVTAESTEFIAGAPGEYRFLLYLRDATGDGWDVLTIFTVR